jgi:hypothetical protein
MWIYNEAILDRTFAAIMTFVMMWVAYGGRDEEAEDAEENALESAAVDREEE